MRKWTKVLGFSGAMAVAPSVAGAAAAVEALQGPDDLHMRSRLVATAAWIEAAGRPAPKAGDFEVTYKVPLLVDATDSAMPPVELKHALAEINAIWAQAGICFEMDVLQRDTGRAARWRPADSADQLQLRFVSGGDELPVFGAYDGYKDVWTRDYPGLNPSPHATEHPAARTASHELGHALGLRHYNGHHDSIDSLMTSGTRGYRLHPREIGRARLLAKRYGEQADGCSEPPVKVPRSR